MILPTVRPALEFRTIDRVNQLMADGRERTKADVANALSISLNAAKKALAASPMLERRPIKCGATVFVATPFGNSWVTAVPFRSTRTTQPASEGANQWQAA